MHSTYSVELASRKVEKQILSLLLKERNRVAETIDNLGEALYPHGVKKLASNVYRIRIGRYRVIYEVDDSEKIVIVTKVVKRGEDTYSSF